MITTISRYRNAGTVAIALFVAGCSGNSSGIGDDPVTGGGASSGTLSDGGSGSKAGSSSGDDEDNGDTDASSGSTPGGGGDPDATVAVDASPPRGGSTRDASVHDAAAHDGSMGDAASGGTGGSDAGAALAAARAQCVQIINQDRATLSPASPPLQEDTAAETCVDGQAEADYRANTAHSAFGNCKESAQDECPGWPGPPSAIMTKCLAQMWAEGPPAGGQDNHWLNMSNAKYKKVACGFYQTPDGKWWATQDFF